MPDKQAKFCEYSGLNFWRALNGLTCTERLSRAWQADGTSNYFNLREQWRSAETLRDSLFTLANFPRWIWKERNKVLWTRMRVWLETNWDSLSHAVQMYEGSPCMHWSCTLATNSLWSVVQLSAGKIAFHSLFFWFVRICTKCGRNVCWCVKHNVSWSCTCQIVLRTCLWYQNNFLLTISSSCSPEDLPRTQNVFEFTCSKSCKLFLLCMENACLITQNTS